jgi:ABC-type multidrug transport system fused ATPase/permease subunit
MPEGPEIETDKLHEAIQEEMEKDGGSFLRRIALTTAVLAAFAAIAALKAGATVNEALLLKTESTRLQAQASDQWSYYQAKGLKAAVQQATAASWEAAGKPVPGKLHEQAKRYAEEQAEIKKAAEEKEKERDEKSAESDHLLHQHHRFANAVALFQVSIALGAMAALTRSQAVWWGSMLLGLSGIPLFILAFLG